MFLYRIETGKCGEYDIKSAAEAARVLRWIRSRFDTSHPDPVGFLILKRNGSTIFSASGASLIQSMPEDLSIIVKNGLLRIGEEFRKYSRWGHYVALAADLNENPPEDDTELRQAHLLAWADATHKGYMTAAQPVRYEAYLGRYGVGLIEHYRYGSNTNYHGVRYWIEPADLTGNPFVPQPAEEVT